MSFNEFHDILGRELRHYLLSEIIIFYWNKKNTNKEKNNEIIVESYYGKARKFSQLGYKDEVYN